MKYKHIYFPISKALNGNVIFIGKSVTMISLVKKVLKNIYKFICEKILQYKILYILILKVERFKLGQLEKFFFFFYHLTISTKHTKSFYIKNYTFNIVIKGVKHEN